MSWHHIIPFALFRDVWNRFVDQHIATQLMDARVAIRQYLLLCDTTLRNVDELIDRMRAENTAQRRAGHHVLRALDIAETNQLATAATWPAWNIVEGPSARSDDPGDRYCDRFTAGLTAEEAIQMRAVEDLFQRLKTFATTGPAPGAPALRVLADSVSLARSNLRRDLPIRYRSEMWVKDSAGLWRKRRDSEPYVPTV